MGEERRELKYETVVGRCEVCGFKGKIMRFSRPLEGHTAYMKDNTLIFKERNVQQICVLCTAKGVAKKLVDLLERPNDPHAKKILEQIKPRSRTNTKTRRARCKLACLQRKN